MCDNFVCDNVVCDNVVCDNVVCERVVCDNAVCDNVVGGTKYHACHAKCTFMSPSATPATKRARSCHQVRACHAK